MKIQSSLKRRICFQHCLWLTWTTKSELKISDRSLIDIYLIIPWANSTFLTECECNQCYSPICSACYWGWSPWEIHRTEFLTYLQAFPISSKKLKKCQLMLSKMCQWLDYINIFQFHLDCYGKWFSFVNSIQ